MDLIIRIKVKVGEKVLIKVKLVKAVNGIMTVRVAMGMKYFMGKKENDENNNESERYILQCE